MPKQLFANNAIGRLNAGITDAAVSIVLQAGQGALFPSPTGGDWFLVTLYDIGEVGEINHEVVKCTARTGDTLTVTRAQEGTTGRAFLAGTPVELRVTKGTLTDIATTSISVTTATIGTGSGVLKVASGAVSVASAGTDYQAPIGTISGIAKGNGANALTAAVAGTDYLAPGAIGSTVQAYDADTAKLDVAQSWTAQQTFGSGAVMSNSALTTIKTATFNSQATIATTSGSINIDWSAAQNYIQTEPTGTITYTFTNPPGPCHLQLLIDSDGTSTAQTINWPSLTWIGATWAGANNKKAIINFWFDGTNYFAQGANQV